MIRIDKFLPVKVGDPAPQFAEKTIDGKELRLSDYGGRFVLLDFWATWCAPCMAELPNLKTAYEKYAAEGRLVIIGVSLDSDVKDVRNFVRERSVSWAQLALGPAETNAVAKAYHVSSVPATFLIGPDGKIAASDLNGQALQDELARLLSSTPRVSRE